MENFPVKIVRQTLPRTFCGEKMPGRGCRGLFGAKNGSAEAAEGFLRPKNARQRPPRTFWGQKTARQRLPRISCGEKVCGRGCRRKKNRVQSLFGAMDSFICFRELFLSCSPDEAGERSRQCATFRSRAGRRVPSPDPHGSRA